MVYWGLVTVSANTSSFLFCIVFLMPTPPHPDTKEWNVGDALKCSFWVLKHELSKICMFKLSPFLLARGTTVFVCEKLFLCTCIVT